MYSNKVFKVKRVESPERQPRSLEMAAYDDLQRDSFIGCTFHDLDSKHLSHQPSAF